ncbi:hypothetical protein BGW42_006741 [Actinomortierella wolfii]|nr:hypothetical protein BGW42_006741 [Actinomortierella wolfii]
MTLLLTSFLWRVSVPVPAKKDPGELWLADVPSKKELNETDDIADDFTEVPPKKTIHIVVQRPPPLGTETRPLVDIKRITDGFIAPGSDVTRFLDAFVKSEGTLPTTTGAIRGLPSAWRRGLAIPHETRPSLLFMDLPGPSTPNSGSKNLVAGSILDLVAARQVL